MQLKFWSSKYAPGPGFIPRWVSAAMFILSVIAFIQSLKEDGITLDKVLPAARASRINLYVCWGGLIFFFITVKKIGFVLASTILLAALFSRGTKWPIAIILSIIISLICFYIFKVILQIQIPINQFGW
jgi:t-SNARE complex subunit (syntaxin)